MSTREATANALKTQKQTPSQLGLSDEEFDQLIQSFENQDENRRKTWTRIIVENYLSKFGWYFPLKDKKNGPSLSKAYAYYEHITLPRHFSGDQDAGHVLRRAEIGEPGETELYSPFFTPASSLIEWGIGVDLYFSTLRIMAFVLLIAAFFNIPTMLYFAGDDYSPAGKGDLDISLQGTAICTTFEWVVCQDCTANRYDKYDDKFERVTYLESVDAGGNPVTLVQKNACEQDKLLTYGMINWVTLIFLGVTTALVSQYLRAREVRFDEDKLTATDYSLIVKNPPGDCYDPDIWRDFFSPFAKVTAVTVALNNEELLRKLIARRIHRNNLRLALPKGIDLEDEDIVRSAVAKLVQEREAEPKGCITRFLEFFVFPPLRLVGMFLKPETLVDKVFQLTDEIKELQQKDYKVSRVFVTFENEEGQRAALSALSVGRLDIMLNRKTSVSPQAIFRDRILRVMIPAEPSAIRWLDLSISFWKKTAFRALNLFIICLIIWADAQLISSVRSKLGSGYSAPLVAALNSIIPQVVKILMMFESHSSEGSYQTSLYLKITLFRWVNTAILTQFITPFTDTISDITTSAIPTIKSIVLAELYLTPAIRLVDMVGNLKKHILAPRAPNQDLMNKNFQGTFYNLGERYTDLTKVLFLVFFYSALAPVILFFGAGILILQYFTDKYMLMRVWGWTPLIGSELAQFSRRYFFSGSVLAFALVSAFAWAQFPYDNLCFPPEQNPNEDFSGLYPVTFPNGTESTVEVKDEFKTSYISCFQDWRKIWRADDGIFPLPTTGNRLQEEGREWMSGSQEDLTAVYGWTSLAVLVGFVVIYFGTGIRNFILSYFKGVVDIGGQNQNIDFSCNREISIYIPQIKRIDYPFPFLACDIDTIDQDLIGFNDPHNSYDFHNLIFDVPWEGMQRKERILKNTRSTMKIAYQEEYLEATGKEKYESERYNIPRNPIFSLVKHYPPSWLKPVRAKEADEGSMREQSIREADEEQEKVEERA